MRYTQRKSYFSDRGLLPCLSVVYPMDVIHCRGGGGGVRMGMAAIRHQEECAGDEEVCVCMYVVKVTCNIARGFQSHWFQSDSK